MFILYVQKRRLLIAIAVSHLALLLLRSIFSEPAHLNNILYYTLCHMSYVMHVLYIYVVPCYPVAGA
jgi:hypothetical protein